MSATVLRAHALGFGRSPDRRPLFEGLGFDLSAGEVLVLLGRNGAGKTSLLRALAGFDRPLAGEMLLMDKPLDQWSPAEKARRMAVMTTERSSLPWWTVREVVALGRQPHTGPGGKLRPEDEAAVERALERTGIAAFAGQRFDRLSDGEKQTVLIARAIAQETPLLLLDEPTAHLDFVGRKACFDLFAKLAREKSAAVLLATHEVETALGTADRVLLLDRAHGWHFGTPRELLRTGALEKAFGPLGGQGR